MVKLYNFLLLLILPTLFANSLSANPDEYKLVKTVDETGSFLEVDQLGNFYLVNDKNQIVRYDSTGVNIGTYSENRYGSISAVDATSPFNLLVVFQDFATLTTVDNRLNTKNLFKLNALDINFISAACLSHDNYFWVFDQQANMLKKINAKYEIIYQSDDISQMLGMKVTPNFLIERDGFIFLNDPRMGIIVFDIYGTYYSSFPIQGLNSFQVIKNNIVFHRDGELHVFNYTSQESYGTPLPKGDDIIDLRVTRDRLYILTNDGVKIYAK